MASPIGLQFSVEIEILVSSRNKKHRDWNATGAFDLKHPTADDIKLMAHKAQEANITLEKFKKLYGYK
ncbi:hypothetical protein PG990_014415 [Apiospora arundinis]